VCATFRFSDGRCFRGEQLESSKHVSASTGRVLYQNSKSTGEEEAIIAMEGVGRIERSRVTELGGNLHRHRGANLWVSRTSFIFPEILAWEIPHGISESRLRCDAAA
jgi:hypothetical protein